MTIRRARRRGEPLVVLGAIMVCWIGARAAIWQLSSDAAGPVSPEKSLSIKFASPAVGLRGASFLAMKSTPLSSPAAAEGPVVSHPETIAPVAPPPLAADRPLPLPLPAPPPLEPSPVAPGLAGGHAMIWLAAVGKMPRPEALLAAAAAQPAAAAAPTLSDVPHRAAAPALSAKPLRAQAERRWSADAWALVRSGDGAVGTGSSLATYGGSQIGAVLRYRLAPGNPHRPIAYLRASAALNGSSERELAAGLSVRPIAALPVVVAAEGRVGRLGGRTVTRPAVMAVTELAPITLPQQTRAEFYLQGGYVGGVGATPFIDGQLRIDRRVAQVGPVELRAGAAAWGGAQRGAGRLDVGPSATLGITKGSAAARVGLDWRFRVEGKAEPASGPALTISAGF